jgi:hypothetical protein
MLKRWQYMKLILMLWCHKIIRILNFRGQDSYFSQDESCGLVTSCEGRGHCLNHPLYPLLLNGSPILSKHWAQSSRPRAGSKYIAHNVRCRPFNNYLGVAAIVKNSVGMWQVSSPSYAYSRFISVSFRYGRMGKCLQDRGLWGLWGLF